MTVILMMRAVQLWVDKDDLNVWEDNWDDDSFDDDFSLQLRWVDKDDLNVWEDNWDDDNIDDCFYVQLWSGSGSG